MGRLFQNHDNKITSGYGQRSSGFHNGIDVVAKGQNNESLFDNIVAHTGGTVVISAFDRNGYGNYVKIKHTNGYFTLYAHMENRQVNVVQSVAQGQVIGIMGNTGNSFGAHLHFEVRNQSDVRIDPTPYINSDLPTQGYKILEVDGYLGTETTLRLQEYFGTIQDGMISKPSDVIKAIQRVVGAEIDALS